MKPHVHSLRSVKKFGGKPEDYQPIHDWFDQTKAHIADMRHRAILHNSFGIFLCEQVFGDIDFSETGTPIKRPYITNSDGKHVQVRDIAEQHVLEDMGGIPSLSDFMNHLPTLNTLGGKIRKSTLVIVD